MKLKFGINKEKDLMITAKLLSMIFNPFYLPVLGIVILFLFSYMIMFPWWNKILILAVVSCFTILLPTVLINVYRHYQGWTHLQLSVKRKRAVPYLISSLCYLGCIYVMNALHIPHLIKSILFAALILQLICAVINHWWKISTHSAATGAVIGALLAFALIFDFNPMWWLCLLLIMSGAVGSSRIILRQHTVMQVVGGSIIGGIITFILILFY